MNLQRRDSLRRQSDSLYQGRDETVGSGNGGRVADACRWYRFFRHREPLQTDAYPTIFRPVCRAAIRRHGVLFTVESHRDLRLLQTALFEILHNRQCPAPRQLAIGQAIALIVGVTVQDNVIDCRVSLQVVDNDLQVDPGQRIQLGAAAGETDLALSDLLKVFRQEPGGTGLVITIGLAEPYREQAYFGDITLAGVMPYQGAAPLNQASKQIGGLGLGAVEKHLSTANTHRTQVNIPTARLPGAAAASNLAEPSLNIEL